MKTQKQKLNVKLLRKIQRHILEEPRRFFMDWYVARGTPGKSDFRVPRNVPWFPDDLSPIVPPCGTAACIAGWANLFTGHRPSANKQAQQELKLTDVQARNLFTVCNWPAPYCGRYENARTSKSRAKIAAARIEHLIKNGE